MLTELIQLEHTEHLEKLASSSQFSACLALSVKPSCVLLFSQFDVLC